MTGVEPNLTVTPDTVRDLGHHVLALARELSAALDAAGRDVDALTHADWHGRAADAYAAGWRECHDGGRRILAALTDMADRLGVNAQAYRATDDTAAEHLELEGL
jgi:WXG100 family type VII secretion target